MLALMMVAFASLPILYIVQASIDERLLRAGAESTVATLEREMTR